MGDIIFSLPAIRALGGGVLYLDPEGGERRPLVKWPARTRTRLNAQAIESLKPFLSQQPYLTDVRLWQGETVDHDLDEFRSHNRYQNISDAHLAALGLPFEQRDTAWLTVPDPILIPKRPIVISRSVRWQGNHEFWEQILPQIKDQCVFVGWPKEHEIFEYTYGQKVPWHETPDVLTLARVIAGCRDFFGNAGLAHALAEGMKKRLTCEVYRAGPGIIFKREGATYV